MNKKILTISTNAWDDSLCTGNTFSNFLGFCQESEVANIFCRAEIPNNSICKKYYRITEKDIFFSVKNGLKAGGKYNLETAESNSNKTSIENNYYSYFTNFRPTLFLFLREMMWGLGTWKSDELNQFIDEFQPNIIYMHGHNNFYTHKILKYCHKRSNAKVVLFFGDDMYSYKSKNPFVNIYQFYLRKWLNNSIAYADLLYGGTKEICLEYSKIFNKRFDVLYKGCSFNKDSKQDDNNEQIKFVYTGNLLYGRWKVLAKLANQIATINNSKQYFELCIYTQTPLTAEMNKCLNIKGVSTVYGKILYKEVKTVLRQADIVLHVESFLKNEIKKTRLSFSTKIIDCLQSGSCVMAIGPYNISSINYLISTEACIVVTKMNELNVTINNLKNNRHMIEEYANKMQLFAYANHDIDNVRRNIESSLDNLFKTEGEK